MPTPRKSSRSQVQNPQLNKLTRTSAHSQNTSPATFQQTAMDISSTQDLTKDVPAGLQTLSTQPTPSRTSRTSSGSPFPNAEAPTSALPLVAPTPSERVTQESMAISGQQEGLPEGPDSRVGSPLTMYLPSSTAGNNTVSDLEPRPSASVRSQYDNQERAYVAASRRSDRSLEARVQSARMASEVHKKRTGKYLKITEEIVANEQMYEEEEPTGLRSLTNHLQTGSEDFNKRLQHYVEGKLGMSNLMTNLTHADSVDRQFREMFPGWPFSERQMAATRIDQDRRRKSSPAGDAKPMPKGIQKQDRRLSGGPSPTSVAVSKALQWQERQARKRGSVGLQGGMASPNSMSPAHSPLMQSPILPPGPSFNNPFSQSSPNVTDSPSMTSMDSPSQQTVPDLSPGSSHSEGPMQTTPPMLPEQLNGSIFTSAPPNELRGMFGPQSGFDPMFLSTDNYDYTATSMGGYYPISQTVADFSGQEAMYPAMNGSVDRANPFIEENPKNMETAMDTNQGWMDFVEEGAFDARQQ